MMLFESLIFNLLPAAVGIMAVVLVFESCWRKCPPDKLMIVSGAGKMRSVSGKGTFVIPLLQRVDTLSLGAVQVQLTTENDIPTQDAILIHACAVANFQIGQTPELIETASKNYLNLDKEEMTRQVTEVMLGKMREVIGQMDLKELMRDRESFNAKVFGGSKDDLANLGLELRTFNVQDFSDSQGIIRSMGADQAAEIKKEAELAQIKAAEEVAIRQNQLDLKQADLKKQADKAKAEADMVKATVTAEKQRELYIAQQEAAERDRIRAQAAARVQEAERHRREAECLFEYRFSCSPYSAMAYEAFHPELCERRVSKRRKQELVVYRLPDGSEPSGYAEMSVPADYADSSHVVPSVFISGTGGDRAWRDIDFDEAERKFAAAARRAAAFREGKPKLMQDEARRAAIRETRHRVCTAPILKSIKEIHR